MSKRPAYEALDSQSSVTQAASVANGGATTWERDASTTCQDEDLLTFFKRLPEGDAMDRLLSEPGVVLSLFRSLSDVLKCTVLRLLDLQEPIRWEPVIMWHAHDRQAAFHAVSSLRTLRLLTLRRVVPPSTESTVSAEGVAPTSSVQQSEAGSTAGSSAVSRPRHQLSAVRYELNPRFRDTLRTVFHDGAGFKAPSKLPKHTPTRSQLHLFAARQWKSVLEWLLSGQLASPGGLMLAGGTSILCRVLQAVGATREETAWNRTTPPPEDLMTVLRRLDLAQEQHHRTPVKIELASQTFQWLLRDIRSQLLSICLEYLRSVDDGTIHVSPTPFKTDLESPRNATPGGSAPPPTPLPSAQLPASRSDCAQQAADVLAFLFTLSELQIGQRFLHLAYAIGLVWMHKATGGKHFFPTPLAKLLQPSNCLGTFELPDELYHASYLTAVPEANAQDTNDPTGAAVPLTPHGVAAKARESGVIVESNFKVFAYTSCPLLLTVVVRLCEIRVITPSLIVGVLTRDTVREAYKAGVTAEQVIRFFTTHSHPSVYEKAQRQRKPVLPENVSAQMCIWEEERRRVRMYRACVMEFAKEQDLDVFPIVVARSQHCTIMHTECPPTTDTTSDQFKTWKTAMLARMKGRPQPGEAVRATAPVLAVHAQYKDELTNLVRAAIRASRQ